MEELTQLLIGRAAKEGVGTEQTLSAVRQAIPCYEAAEVSTMPSTRVELRILSEHFNVLRAPPAKWRKPSPLATG